MHLWKSLECLTEGKWKFGCHEQAEVLSSCDKASQQEQEWLYHLPRAGVPSSTRDSWGLKDHFHDEKGLKV